MPDFSDELIEKACRALINSTSKGRVDPDMMVQAGTPEVYGTPSGDVFGVCPGAESEFWRMFIPTARALLEVTERTKGEHERSAAE